MLSSQQHRDGGAGQASVPERCSPQGEKLEICIFPQSYLYLNGFNPRTQYHMILLQSSPHLMNLYTWVEEKISKDTYVTIFGKNKPCHSSDLIILFRIGPDDWDSWLGMERCPQ